MSLDLTRLSKQVREMSGALAQSTSDTSRRIAQVFERYQQEAGAEEQWARAVDLSRSTANWLLSRPVEPLDTVVAAPPRPPDYAIVATDGSHIEVDRHGVAEYYLINTGRVHLRYGSNATARLSSQPALYYEEHDLYLTSGTRHIAIEGNYLSARRDVEELQAVVELADEFLTDDDDTLLPRIALQDGTLMRWALSGAEKIVQERFLFPYLAGLEHLRKRGIAVASYISRSRGTELVGTIRLMFCPDVNLDKKQGANCSRCSDEQAGREPSCRICNGLMDADILFNHLAEGQRGPLFLSMSRINAAYGVHEVHYFHMRIGREIARVEIPRWVAEHRAAVDEVHSLIYDQCIKGQGYPVALARAHEQAVVRTSDRRTLQRMLENSLLRASLNTTTSRKRESKDYSRT